MEINVGSDKQKTSVENMNEQGALDDYEEGQTPKTDMSFNKMMNRHRENKYDRKKKDKEGRGKKAMKKIEKRDESLPILPRHLILEILSRLPVKSLVRFKSVSKSWLTLFTDPFFVKMHLNRSHKRKKLVFPCKGSEFNYGMRLVVFSSDNIDEPRKIHVDSLLQFPAAESSSIRILGSCDGLILCLTDDRFLHMVNPSTREFQTLSESPFNTSFPSYGFGYDGSTDDYKIVEISSSPSDENTASVYTSKTNVWRRIQDIPYQVMSIEPATLLNGALHWLTKDKSKIVSLNLADEKFQYFLLPDFETRTQDYFFSAFKGCPCVCLTRLDDPICYTESWVMKEYGKRESWTSIRHHFFLQNRVKPLDYSNNDEILFFRHAYFLYVFNLEKNTHRLIKIPYDAQFRSLQFDEAETFLETIVSTGGIALNRRLNDASV
ncbi:F-box/kelch-repeat protein At3g06240-like [Cornus florida]|uniref:F-box/kelch-repeat protein At3g06240-like n=1 Tax=Cornus florida TaxID=4283 RepID=UPI00289A534E|nr:F-box/kelch-repeat protein At3g06240-like [Cornus florida]